MCSYALVHMSLCKPISVPWEHAQSFFLPCLLKGQRSKDKERSSKPTGVKIMAATVRPHGGQLWLPGGAPLTESEETLLKPEVSLGPTPTTQLCPAISMAGLFWDPRELKALDTEFPT